MARSLRAGAIRTPPLVNVHHAILSMLLAVRPLLAPREIEGRLQLALTAKLSLLSHLVNTAAKRPWKNASSETPPADRL